MPKLIFKVILVLYFVCCYSGAYSQKQGQALSDSLLAELAKTKEDTNRVNLLQALTVSFWDQKEARLKYARQSLEIATKLGWEKGIRMASNSVGLFIEDDGKYDSALLYFNNALKISEHLGSKYSTVMIIINIGDNHLYRGDYARSLEYFYRALKISEEINSRDGILCSVNDIGRVSSFMKDYPKALECYLRGLKINEEKKDKYGIAASYYNIGCAYDGMNKSEKGIEYTLKTLSIAEEIGDKYLVSRAAGSLGSTYGNRKQYVEALKYLKKSLAVNEEILDKAATGYDLHNIGGVYFYMAEDTVEKIKKIVGYINSHADKEIDKVPVDKAGLLAAAIEYQQRSLAIGKAHSDINLMKASYEDLAKAFKLGGDYKNALDASENYNLIKDSVFTKENGKKIVELGMNYEFEKKDAIAKTELQWQKKVKNGFIGGFAVVLLFAGVFFSQRNKIKAGKKKSDELLLNILPEEVAEELKAKGRQRLS